MSFDFSKALVYFNKTLEVIKSSNGTPEEIEEFYREYKNDSSCLFWISRNSNTPKKILKRLAKHKNASVRWNVILNPSTDGEVIVSMQKDKDPEIVRMVNEKIELYKRQSIEAWK